LNAATNVPAAQVPAFLILALISAGCPAISCDWDVSVGLTTMLVIRRSAHGRAAALALLASAAHTSAAHVHASAKRARLICRSL
jgi:hypothetical protein